MTKKIQLFAAVFMFVTSTTACFDSSTQPEILASPKGKLFIIGGGSKSPEMVLQMVALSGIDSNGYAVILPMASESMDTAIFYANAMLQKAGVHNIYPIVFDSGSSQTDTLLDRLKGAKLIYISGGDQVRFMKAIANSRVKEIIQQAYLDGATIAGTSAGAAVMSKKMLTGDQLKYPVYTGDYKTIEANNIQMAEGLGLLPGAIVDQHFIKRQRLNRLIAVCLENPEETCIGIDESTAIIVSGQQIEVTGESQVLLLKHPTAETKVVNGLLGGHGLELDVFLPGDKFSIAR
jgi:cyanophycinase